MATGLGQQFQTEEQFPPKELVTKCNMLAQQSHSRLGWSGLRSRITTRHNLVALACLGKPMVTVMGTASAAGKYRFGCWLAAMALIVSAWAFSWWVLLGLIVVIPLERIVARLERLNWLLMASVLLSLEMLANDFAGWGRAYPEAQRRAIKTLGQFQTEWLDLYLPRRANIDATTLKGFGPTA